jgi:hypothetical protein
MNSQVVVVDSEKDRAAWVDNELDLYAGHSGNVEPDYVEEVEVRYDPEHPGLDDGGEATMLVEDRPPAVAKKGKRGAVKGGGVKPAAFAGNQKVCKRWRLLGCVGKIN